MKNILITGATGNVGKTVIRFLLENKVNVIAGVRNIKKAETHLQNNKLLSYRSFDFENKSTYKDALNNINTLFILRPPHISDVNKYFLPLIETMVQEGIKKVVFLSVQGVEKSTIIPHHKIEKLLVESGIEYIFVRPSYFMQNLSTTFLDEIINENSLNIPAGKGIFNWIDVENIGEATAQFIINFEKYKNKGYDITGSENKNFSEACSELSNILGRKINYHSSNLIKFYRLKRKSGMNKGYIIVMIMLHFLPRFQKAPVISNNYKMLTGKDPITLKAFFKREKNLFIKE